MDASILGGFALGGLIGIAAFGALIGTVIWLIADRWLKKGWTYPVCLGIGIVVELIILAL